MVKKLKRTVAKALHAYERLKQEVFTQVSKKSHLQESFQKLCSLRYRVWKAPAAMLVCVAVAIAPCAAETENKRNYYEFISKNLMN